MMVLHESIEIAGKLTGLNLPLLIAHLIASVVMLGFLVFFVYKPFNKWMLLRENKLKKDFQITQNTLDSAEKFKSLAENRLKKAKLIAQQVLVDAKNENVLQKKKILEDAQRLKKQILLEAQLKSDQLKSAVKTDIEKAILENAILLAEKMMVTSLDQKQHQKLIQDFIEGLDE